MSISSVSGIFFFFRFFFSVFFFRFFSGFFFGSVSVLSFFSLFLTGNLIAIDLAFLRPLSIIRRTEITKGARPTIILVVMDVASRFVQLRVCKTAKATEVQSKLENCLAFFAPHNNYKKCVSDRGSETRGLGDRLGLTHYHIQQGPWRKVSIGWYDIQQLPATA